jgi:hypothetical protein
MGNHDYRRDSPGNPLLLALVVHEGNPLFSVKACESRQAIHPGARHPRDGRHSTCGHQTLSVVSGVTPPLDRPDRETGRSGIQTLHDDGLPKTSWQAPFGPSPSALLHCYEQSDHMRSALPCPSGRAGRPWSRPDDPVGRGRGRQGQPRTAGAALCPGPAAKWTGGERPIPCHNFPTAPRLTWLSSWRGSLPTRRIPCHLAKEPPCPVGSSPSPPPPGCSVRPPRRSWPSPTWPPPRAAPISRPSAAWSASSAPTSRWPPSPPTR